MTVAVIAWLTCFVTTVAFCWLRESLHSKQNLDSDGSKKLSIRCVGVSVCVQSAVLSEV